MPSGGLPAMKGWPKRHRHQPYPHKQADGQSNSSFHAPGKLQIDDAFSRAARIDHDESELIRLEWDNSTSDARLPSRIGSDLDGYDI